MSLQIPNSNIFPGDTNLCPAALLPVFPQILFSTILAPFHKSFKKSPFLTIQQGIDLVHFFPFTFHSSAATFSSLSRIVLKRIQYLDSWFHIFFNWNFPPHFFSYLYFHWQMWNCWVGGVHPVVGTSISSPGKGAGWQQGLGGAELAHCDLRHHTAHYIASTTVVLLAT